MGDIGDKALLDLRKICQANNLSLHTVGHFVEGPRQDGDDVLAASRQALLEVALCETLGRLGCETHGSNGETDNKQCHHANGEHQC